MDRLAMDRSKMRRALCRLLPSLLITTGALHRLRVELEANRVIRKRYKRDGGGCLLYWLIGCESIDERQETLGYDPNSSVVIDASAQVIKIWDAAEDWPDVPKALLSGIILEEINAELHRREHLPSPPARQSQQPGLLQIVAAAS